VGKFSTPQLFDLDQDGKLDLIIGEQAGNLNYFKTQAQLQILSFSSLPIVWARSMLQIITFPIPATVLPGFSETWKTKQG
jgi:hypothetical protein